MTMKTIPRTVDSRAKAWNVFVCRLKFAEGLNNYLQATCDVTSMLEGVGANIRSLTLPKGTWRVMKASDSATTKDRSVYLSSELNLQCQTHSLSGTACTEILCNKPMHSHKAPVENRMSNPNMMNYSSGGEIQESHPLALVQKNSSHLT